MIQVKAEDLKLEPQGLHLTRINSEDSEPELRLQHVAQVKTEDLGLGEVSPVLLSIDE